MYTAVERMAQHHIGCLAVTEGSDPKGKIIGVLSERDYLCKVALLGKRLTLFWNRPARIYCVLNYCIGKSSKDISVSEICTQGAANLVVVNHDDPIDACMKKLLSRDIRHLLIRGESGEIDSMLSVKDLVKVVLARHNAVVQKLTDFALGQKSYYKK